MASLTALILVCVQSNQYLVNFRHDHNTASDILCVLRESMTYMAILRKIHKGFLPLQLFAGRSEVLSVLLTDVL